MKDTKKPKIRFKGFNDSWEQRKLGDIAKFINGRAYAQNELLQSGKYKVLRVGNFYTNDSWYYSDLELDDKYYANDGDLLYTWSATFGPHIWRGDRVIYHYHIWKIDLTDELEKHFAVQLLEQDKNDILSGYNGSTMAHITKEGMEQKKVVIPKNIGEQRQLGLFFDNLDHLITLHQRECEKLLCFKKSMLEKMFPKNGEKYPEIRFSGFTDSWEQCKLLDCIQKITDFRGRTPKKLGMDWSKEGYLALSALNVKDGYIDFNQDVHYGNQELYDKWMTGNELHKGQVLFTTEAPMGNVAQVPDNRRYILSQRAIAFDVKDNLLIENFLATVLRTPTVFAYLTGLSSGGTAKGVSQKSLSSVEIRLPKDLKEQEKIADTFSNLDCLITLHQREVEKLVKLKKSMLEKMFI